MNDGKKESVKRVKDRFRENKSKTHCDKCGGELTKLETTIGDPFREGDKYFYWMYWICLCDKCGKVKVKESKFRTMNYPTGGKYMDRTRLGWRSS